MTILHVPITFANIAEWVRRAGGAINQLITGKLDLSGGTLTGDLIVPDEAYGAGWNGSLEVPTKNALYDKIETISGGGVSDGDKGDIVVSSSGAVWEFDTGVVTAFAKTFLDDADAGAVRTTLSAAAASHTHAQADVTGLTTADSPQFAGINLGHASDTTLTRVSAGVVAVEGVNVITTAGGTFTGDISVPDEAYGSGWNASTEAPTKNAVYDKIESLTLGDLTFIGRTAVTAAATVDIALPDGYDSFDIEFHLAPGTDNVGFQAQITDDNFATVESGASDYSWSQFRYTTTTGISGDLDDSLLQLLTVTQGNAAGEYNAGTLRIVNAKEASHHTIVEGDFSYVTTAGAFGMVKFGGRYRVASSINGIRLQYTSGTATGFYKVWGRTT